MKVATSLADVLPPEALSETLGWSVAAGLARAPEALVHPETTEEVATTLAWAAAQQVGVLPVASGRRVATRPFDRPYVVLRTDRLRGIEIYEPADLTLTARAGTPLAELSARLTAHRQWLPFDPPHVDERTLGGLVATGESGPVSTGYGELRNHVLGMTIVTGEGGTLRLGGRVVKNVAGFDVLKPMVGSRGRLAVITSVCVRAFPEPAEDRLLVLRGANAADLCDTAGAVGTAPVLPVSCVLLAPGDSAAEGASLLVRLHGSLPAVDADQRTLERHCAVTFDRPTDQRTRLQEARDAATTGAVRLVAAVLPSRVREAIGAIRAALGDVELVADTYVGRVRMAPAAVDVDAATGLRRAIEALGGSLSARLHGSGEDAGPDPTEVVARVTSQVSAAEAELIAGLGRVFDPSDVLWPCRP